MNGSPNLCGKQRNCSPETEATSRRLVRAWQNYPAIDQALALGLSLHTLILEKPNSPHSVQSPGASELHLCYHQLLVQSLNATGTYSFNAPD